MMLRYFHQWLFIFGFKIYIPVYAVCTTICNHSNAHKYSFVSIVFAAFDMWPQCKWLLRWHHSYIHDNTTQGYLNTAIGNFFLQISIIDNRDCYYWCFLSIYQLYEYISFPIFHCIHISCSVTKVSHFGIIILQMVIFILIYNSTNYDFCFLFLPSTLLPSCFPITNLM